MRYPEVRFRTNWVLKYSIVLAPSSKSEQPIHPTSRPDPAGINTWRHGHGVGYHGARPCPRCPPLIRVHIHSDVVKGPCFIQYRLSTCPTNTQYLYNICTKLSQRLWRWSNIVQMLYKYCVFDGWVKDTIKTLQYYWTPECCSPLIVIAGIYVKRLMLWYYPLCLLTCLQIRCVPIL